jgi:subtilisin family serine protease
MRIIAALFLIIGCTLFAEAQQSVRYVVELNSEPVLSPASPASRHLARELDPLPREQAAMEARLTAQGYHVIGRLTHILNALIIEGPAGQISTLRAMGGVKRAIQSRTLKMHFDASIGIHQIDSAWTVIPGNTYNPTTNPTGTNLAGKGIKIGIVDTGITPNHPSFNA